MERNDYKYIPLATVGVLKGLYEVYVRPFPVDVLAWMVKRAMKDVDLEAVDEHMASLQYFET